MLNRTITIDLGDHERKAAAASRRFPVSVSSETPVPRRDWGGETWTEVLSHAPGAVDLSRGNLPLLESHDRTRVNVGIVTGLRLDGLRLRGELVLGASQRAVELAADIGAGIVTGLSIGYRIDTEERDEKAKRITARRWTPYEVSIVSVPADVSVGINRSISMDPNDLTPPPPPQAAPEVLAERERVAFILAQADRYRDRGIDSAFAQRLIAAGTPMEVARAALLNQLAAYSDALPPGPGAMHTPTNLEYRNGQLHEPTPSRQAISAGEDFGADFQRAAIDALLFRAGIPVAKPHAAAQDVPASVYDLARISLSRAGKSGSRWFGGEARGPELLKRAASTSDFPAILEGALHASVRNGYENEPSSHRRWVRVASFADLRPASRPILGSAPDLKKIIEGGEYTHGYFSDDGTSYKVEKFGRIVALTWETLVNDNLSAFLRVQPALGQAARRLEADTVYSLFPLNAAAGPTMQDAKALFHTDHANLATTGAFDAALLGAGRTLLRKQTAVGGGYLSLVPKFLIVPAERETTAEQILTNATRRTTLTPVPEWIAQLELVVEPRLANGAVYLATDPSQIDTVEMGLLEENLGGPFMETEQGFSTDETRWKIRHTLGVKALDWRGLVKMPVNP